MRAIKWKIPFKTQTEVDCVINIYEEDWTGGVTMIADTNPNSPGYASDDPFSIEEDDDEDLLKVIRTKTAYIRLVEKEYGSLADLYPSNPKQHYVTFYREDVCLFTGYIQCDSYDNDWKAAPREVELTCLSPLALADSLTFYGGNDFVPCYRTLGSLLKEVIVGLDSGISKVVMPDRHPEHPIYFLEASIASDLFIPAKDNIVDHYTNNAAQIVVYEPKSYSDFLEALCNCYGMIVHDVPGMLVFSKFDYSGKYYEMDTSDIDDDEQSITRTEIAGSDTLTDLESISESYGTDGEETLIRPLNSITINRPKWDNEDTSFPIGRSLKEGITCYYNQGGVWDAAIAENYALELTYHKEMATNVDSDGKIASQSVLPGNIFSPEARNREGLYIGWSGGDVFTIKIYHIPHDPIYLKCTFYVDVRAIGCAINDDKGFHGTLTIKKGSQYWNGNTWTTQVSSISFNVGELDIPIPYIPDYREPVEIKLTKNSSAYGNSNCMSEFRLYNKKDANALKACENYIRQAPLNQTKTTNPNVGFGNETIDLTFADNGTLANEIVSYLGINEAKANIIGGMSRYGSPGEVWDIPTNHYLFSKQNRITTDIRLTDDLPEIPYANPYSFFHTGWKWRIIALGYSAKTDVYTATLHHSTAID